jgi:hypothetical protein
MMHVLVSKAIAMFSRRLGAFAMHVSMALLLLLLFIGVLESASEWRGADGIHAI